MEMKYHTTHFGIQYTTTDYTRNPKALTCHIHHLATAINAEGQVAYCKRLRDKPEWSAGNLSKDSLVSILGGKRNKNLSRDITPQNCGINCPYIELNEYIDRVVTGSEDISPTGDQEVKHPNFF
jgi:radical SAM protein with 4Fe4S-binding SPASM domain